MKVGHVFANPDVFPRFAVLNPEFTYTLPRYQMVAGIFDIMNHITEQYFSGTDDSTSDYLAEGLMRSLVRASRAAVRDPRDYEARSNIMWCATWALNTLVACGKSTDWEVHMLGQAVGALPVPTREGYVFLGWFDEAGSRYDASTVYSTADGVTLTARWGQEDSTFTITLNANGGKVEPSALAVVYGQAVGALPVPTREGYTFGGWYDKDGNRYDASSVYSVKGDTTLTARWIENSVQTGDGFPIFLLSGAMMAAAAGAVMLLLKRRKLMGE